MSADILHSASSELEAPAKRPRLTSPEAHAPVDDTADEKPLTQEHIFRNLRLRRIVRENHNGTVAQLALMFYRPSDVGLNGHGTGGMPAYERTFDKRGSAIRDSEDCSNLLGTAGHTQTSIYDNENCGDHLDVMSHFQLPSESTSLLRTCCWIQSPGDALLAIAGEDKLVHIISLAWTREIRVLSGHAGTIVDLQPHPTDSSLLASVSSDQTVRIWSAQTGNCLCIYSCNATAARFHPDGIRLFIGSALGGVSQWPVPTKTNSATEPLRYTVEDSTVITPDKRGTGSAIDCLQFAKSNLLVKNVAGRIEYLDLDSGSVIRAMSVRNHGVCVSRFDVSYDDCFLCVGNSRGEVYIYCVDSGKVVGHLVHKRSVRQVTCCRFSRDCRSVVYTGEGGFIWRYDYVDDETLAEWEKPGEGASEDSAEE
ncbi:hypothetical protein IWW38_000190 [Coemansia aciculifera]|uniref:Uncharacterized protein n=1 Tax=Coemansia aciculifera TaxID=417176 RepID=A0ACC1MAL4_9FUNG|nr:hypothetical protein IWW38_000190 [Coemansia aciculifera]